MSDLIDALDDALGPVGSSQGVGEDAILRRPFGTGANQGFVSVKVRLKITGWFPRSSGGGGGMITVGVTQDFYEFIMSPSQIKAAQWPGGHMPQIPPFDVDQSIPRANSDDIVLRGMVRNILFIDPVVIGNEIVRINGRLEG